MAHAKKNIKIILVAVLLTKLHVLIINLARKLFLTEQKRFIQGILEEYDYCRRMIKIHFNENLIMSAEEEERFQLTNHCWICDNIKLEL